MNKATTWQSKSTPSGVEKLSNQNAQTRCCTHNNDVPADTNAKQMNTLHSDAAASGNDTKTVNLADHSATNNTINACNNNQIESCMRGLDTGDADAMCQLACFCLEGSISDELVQEIANNKTFKAKLYELARNYALGFAEPDSDCEAFQLFKYVEDQNDPDVLCALGRAYQFGWGVEKDVAKAVEYYVKAADVGSFEAMERLYDCKNKNVTKQLKAAFEHFKQQVDAGNENARFAVAACYYDGIEVAKNDQLAVEMCQAIENQQNSSMVILLGWLYEYGNGVKKDEAKAFELYKQAAEAGNKQGQYQLGVCYESDSEIAKNHEQAVFWYEKAAAQRHADAAYRLGNCYECGLGVHEDLFKAFQYYKQAAITGSHWGQCDTGNCYYYGKGVEQNYERAAYWLRKAAAQGHTNVAKDLNYCLEQLCKTRNVGIDIPRTEPESEIALSVNANQQHAIAFYLAKLAAEQNNSRAFLCLGDCYFNGIGTARDITAAAVKYCRTYQLDPALLDCGRIMKLSILYQNGLVDYYNEINAFALLQHANSMLRTEINGILRQLQ